MKNFLKKYGYSVMTLALTFVAAGASTRCCYYILHQPKVPENLKKFSKN